MYPRFKIFALSAGVVALCFVLPLWELARFALRVDLYSYVILVPFISGWLLWQKREHIEKATVTGRRWALLPSALGLALLAWYWTQKTAPPGNGRNDWLAAVILAFLCFVWSASLWLLGSRGFARGAFPLLFLLFMVPLPLAVESGIERFFQYHSAWATHLLLKISGTPVFRDGTLFQVPGFAFDIAPECSGIRSNLVLFMTGLIAGHLFLRRPWARAAIAGAVIVIGIFRNATRIFTLAQLCIHVDPEMIHSPLHRRGGPLFFVLSLIPLFLMLWWLRRQETRADRRAAAADSSSVLQPKRRRAEIPGR